MKVKCIRLLDVFGREVEFSPWLTLGRVYHVMSIEIGKDGKRSYGIVTSDREVEWPSMGGHPAECFEIVSTIVPSNWRPTINIQGVIIFAPEAWQVSRFFADFCDRDPAVYPIFERERNIILNEDP